MKTEKLNLKDRELIEETKEIIKRAHRFKQKKIGNVGSMLITKKRNKYFGVCVDLYCGLGGCAERGAILNMIANGETEIDTIVAVVENKILPPCGVCREMILQINRKNLNTNVIISKTEKTKLNELLPNKWQEVSGDW